MGKKAKLYLLVLVNLMVWGYVGCKVYSALQGDDEIDYSLNQTKIKTIDKPAEEIVEQLALNYDDPFLKQGNYSGNITSKNNNTSRNNQTSVSQKQSVIKVNTTETITPIPSLEIKYLGLVKNSITGNHTALLNVNGRSVTVKQNDFVEGYLIKNISNESILIVKGKEKLLINK